MPTPILRPVLLASLLLTAGVARAQLAMTSPFMPPQGAKGSNAPTADAPLEFRGVAEMPDGPAFRVVDPSKKRGSWVRLNERDADLGIIVKQHDPANDTVTVEQQGRTFTLALHQSKVASSGAATANVVVAPPQMMVPTVAQQLPAAPLQQSQIDAVAAAVAQRRALRDQATQQLNQGQRIAPQVIQQQQQQRGQGAVNPAQTGQATTNGQARPNGQGQNNQRRNRQP